MSKREQILKEFQKIFRIELEDNTVIVDFNSSVDNTDKWDSINNLMIISAVEERYGISFPIEVIFNAENVADMISFIEENANI